ncbi:hypothetical protein D9M73_199270 [compost metagenome]
MDGFVGAKGRPAFQVSQQARQIPVGIQSEGRHLDALEGERQGAIALLHMLALFRPVAAEDVLIEVIDQRIHFRRDA